MSLQFPAHAAVARAGEELNLGNPAEKMRIAVLVAGNEKRKV